MTTDFHSHCLPYMDDGASDADTALKMIAMTRRQGVGRILATPHYYSTEEDIPAFLKRRSESFDRLKLQSGKDVFSDIFLSAEVRLEREISRVRGLEKLFFGEKRCILLEIPGTPLKDWMIQEIENIAYGYSAVPVIAHIDRYYMFYTRHDMERLLNLGDCIFQINNGALFRRKTLKFILSLIGRGLPVIFGSDAHNITSRAPDFDRAAKVMKKANITADDTIFAF